MRIEIDAPSWQAGFNAGLAKLRSWPVPAGIADELAWFSGYIDGEGERLEALRREWEARR